MMRARGVWVLAAVTWGYLAWSLLPVLAAISGSIHPGLGEPIGLDAYRFALRDPEMRDAFAQSVRLAVLTVVIALPLGTALALALAHLIGRPWRLVRLALLSLIALPHSVLAIILFYLFGFPFPLRFDTTAQLLGHVTVALPFVTLIVYVRLASLDPGFEEQAADLGASPGSMVTRVLLPLSLPAVVVAATVAFALSFNEVPISRYLCIPNECRTVPVMFSGRALGTVSPSALAISVIATVISVTTLALALLGVRRLRPRAAP